MKNKTRIFSFIISLVLIISIFTACSGAKEVKTGSTFTYWVPLPVATEQTLKSFNDVMMYQEIEKRTGTKVEFIHPASGSTGTEAFQILLASGDYPDMMEYNWSNYPGGADQAINDGVIISLNDYLKDYAPNYYDYLEGEKNRENNGLYKAQSITDKGNYYGFKTLNIGDYRGFSGLIVRKDILDKWGMSVPTTISDWDILFEKAKSEGFSKPFTCSVGAFSTTSLEQAFNTAYDVGQNYYIEDGKVVFAPFQPGYKEYVAKLAQWVQKGYIDKNFVTNQSTDVEGNMTNDISIACHGWIGGMMGKLMPAMEERNPEYDLVACPYPVMNEGDVVRFQEVQPESQDPTTVITTACENVESAMKWCDFLYSREGDIIRTFGVEGDTYTIENIDGEEHYIYTDKIQKPETVGAASISEALYIFVRPANNPGLNQNPDYLSGYYPYQCQKDALKIWNTNINEAKKTRIPPLAYTDEESSRMAVLNQQYQSGFETSVMEMINGNISIDEYDSIMEKAKNNAFDEILKIQNAAYQRYLKKVK